MDGKTDLIALDWGTSALRAWRISPAGDVLEERREPWGIMHLPQGGFASAYMTITAGWSDPASPVLAIACGMVGSRQGWREVPYLPTPATATDLAQGLMQISPGHPLHLVPGLIDLSDPHAPDVMRGEETQAIGALASRQLDTLLVMPGTHCKWARLHNQRLVSFRTYMTGELFALLRQHSILASGLDTAATPDPAERDDAFVRGVLASFRHGALARLFSTRALALTGRLSPGAVPDYLSGLLIGEELRIETPAIDGAGQIAVTGDAVLCNRYARAFTAIGLQEVVIIPDAALAGLLHIARAATQANPGTQGQQL